VSSFFVGRESDGRRLCLELRHLLGELIVVQAHEVGEERVGEEVVAASELQLTAGHSGNVFLAEKKKIIFFIKSFLNKLYNNVPLTKIKIISIFLMILNLLTVINGRNVCQFRNKPRN
jgi:hypothetical protein